MDSSERYQLLRPYLQAGEQILWSGNPSTTRKRKGKWGLGIFAIFWLAFAVFWTVMASSASGLFGLFGLPFIGIGIYLLYMSFFYPSKMLPRVVYAVTDTRAILLIPTRSGYDMSAFLLRSLPGVSLTDVLDGNGSVVFVPTGMAQTYYDTCGYDTVTCSRSRSVSDFSVPHDRFQMIDGVMDVYRLIGEQIDLLHREDKK